MPKYKVRLDGGPLSGARMEVHRKEDPLELDAVEKGVKVKHVYRKKNHTWEESDLHEYRFDKTKKA